MEDARAAIAELAGSLADHGLEGVELALVLGSGLGGFADSLEGARAIPYDEIGGMPTSAVPGHAGRLVVGEVGGVRVLVQQGRVHLYEGWSPYEVTRAVRAFAALGVRGLVLTNAAGGLREEWGPGTLMRIRDHLDLQPRTPLFAEEAGSGTPYSEAFGRALERASGKSDVALESGVYAGLLGPTYETPAEVRMLRWMGADAVGMSTVAEAAAARAAGLEVAAISCITNHAAGITGEPLSHEEVMEAGRESAGRFCRLLEAAVPELVAALS